MADRIEEGVEKEDMDALQTLVRELRHDVEAKGLKDHDKETRLNSKLDELEEKNQEVAGKVAEAANSTRELKDLKEFLASGAAAAEAKNAATAERISNLELDLARAESKGAKSDADWVESAEYKAFSRFAQVGDGNLLEEEHKVLLRSDSDVDGGFSTTEELDTAMIRKIIEISPIRRYARNRSMSQKSLRMVVRDTIPEAFYEGEAEEDQEGQSKYDSEEMFSYRLGVTIPVTKDLLMDSTFSMDGELMADASIAFAQKEGNKFILGTGFKEPEGFLVNSSVIASPTITAVSATLDADVFFTVQGTLKGGYNAAFSFNRRTLATSRLLKDSQNRYLWSPGLDGPASMTIAGAPYFLADDMPDITNSAYSIAFADWYAGYTIADRTQMSIVRDDLTRKRNAIVEFTFHRWNNGQVVLPEAIKVIQIKA